MNKQIKISFDFTIEGKDANKLYEACTKEQREKLPEYICRAATQILDGNVEDLITYGIEYYNWSNEGSQIQLPDDFSG